MDTRLIYPPETMLDFVLMMTKGLLIAVALAALIVGVMHIFQKTREERAVKSFRKEMFGVESAGDIDSESDDFDAELAIFLAQEEDNDG